MEYHVHTIPPVYDAGSEILILGSFPSVRSRAVGFYYGHPQNRFWRTLAGVYGQQTPETTEEKLAFLHARHIALWDVLAACEIAGSADSSIQRAEPNDISVILRAADVRRIFVNGKTAEKYYDRYLLPRTGLPAVCLPSTSPANASKSLDELIALWKAALL